MQGAIFGDGALVPGVTVVLAVLAGVILVLRLGRRSTGQRRVGAVQRVRPGAAVVLVERTLALDLAAEQVPVASDGGWEPGSATGVVASADDGGLTLWVGGPGEQEPAAFVAGDRIRSVRVEGLTAVVTAEAPGGAVELPLSVLRRDSALPQWDALTSRLRSFASTDG